MAISFPGSTPAFGAVALARASRDAVYRAVWRWHFYAGLLCLPFLVTLSVTGAIYLFKDQIDTSLFAYRNTVVAQANAPLSPDRLLFSAAQAVPDGMPVSFTDPEGPTSSAVVTMAEAGRRILVYLNPYTGDVLDRIDRDREFMMVVRRLHSLAYFGPVANAVIEVAAGFAIILVVTGVYLWWPRQQGGVVSLRGTPRRRVWWRDLHAVTGLVAGAGLFFLAATGLPWSIWWGDQFRAWSNAAGVGQPRALWANKPVSNVPMREMLTTAGWSLQDAPIPMSQPTAADAIGIDRAVAILGGMGMARGYEVSLPVGSTGVYAAAAYPHDVNRQRMISLDQYTGKPLVDVHFSDIGGVARAVQYGIGIHKGEQWGLANQLAMLAFCLATILLSVTAGVMWWKRRPAGGLGVPPWPRDRRTAAIVTGLVIASGALFPLTGLVILGMLGLDLTAQFARQRMAA